MTTFDTQAKTTDFCWLIERSQPEGIYPPEYWVKWRVWTTDATKATRFYDGEPDGCPPELQGRARAQDIANGLHPLPPGMRDKPYCRVVEHGFMSRPADSALTSDPTPTVKRIPQEHVKYLDSLLRERLDLVRNSGDAGTAAWHEHVATLIREIREAVLSRPSDPTDAPLHPDEVKLLLLTAEKVLAEGNVDDRIPHVAIRDLAKTCLAFLSRSGPAEGPATEQGVLPDIPHPFDEPTCEYAKRGEPHPLGVECDECGVAAYPIQPFAHLACPHCNRTLNATDAAVLQRAPVPQNELTEKQVAKLAEVPADGSLTEYQIAQRLKNRADRLLRFLDLPNQVEVITEKERVLIDQAVQLWLTHRAKPGAAPLHEEADTEGTPAPESKR